VNEQQAEDVKDKPLRKLDSAHYDVTGHEVKWYKQTSGRSR